MRPSAIPGNVALAVSVWVFAGCGPTDGSLLQREDASAPSPTDGSSPDAVADGASPASDATLNGNDGGDANDAACSTSLESDRLNCGRCGHDCLGGACVSAQCQPVLLSTAAFPYSTFVDATRVYWASSDSDPGQIMSIAKDGSDPQVIADGVHGCHGIYVDDTNIVWAEIGAPGRVFLANKDGGSALLLTQTNENGPAAIVADDASAYVLDVLQTHGVFQVPRAGEPDAGRPHVLSSGWPYALGLAEDSKNIYWSVQGDANGERGPAAPFDGGVHGEIVSMPKDGSSAPVVLASNLGQPLFVAVDDAAVYWTDTLNQTVMRLPFGASLPIALATAVVGPYAITVDGNDLYFSTIGVTGSDGTIQRMPKDGSAPPVVLVTNLSWPSQIAVDATAIYWANTHGATEMKLAK